MSDTAITTVISKTHVAIITLLSIIGLSSFLIFLTLQEGVLIKRLLLPGFKIEQLYIKWDEKLSLTAHEIIIAEEERADDSTFDPKVIKDAFRSIKYFEQWVEHIAITQMLVGEINATFRYTKKDGALLDLVSDDVKANAKLTWEDPYFLADLTFRDNTRDIDVNGTSVVDLDDLTSYSRLDIVPVHAADLTLYLKADREALSFATRSNTPITQIRPIVELFHLHPKTVPWIVDYSFGTTFDLHSLSGSLRYDNPSGLLHTLYAKATYHDFIYKFQSGLPPIRTSSTGFVFKDGVLDILPHDGHYLRQGTGKSWLNIDFNPSRGPILNAFILTSSRFDEGAVELLDYFNIPLPFVQTKGVMDADLTLNIPLLHVNELQANGDFHIQEGMVDYEGIPLRVTDSHIAVHNSKVDVKKVDIAYKEMIDISVTGAMDFKHGITDLSIDVDKADIPLGESRFSLDTKKHPLSMRYALADGLERIFLERSSWRYAGHKIDIKAFTAPFDFATASVRLPKLFASIKGMADLSVSGPIDLKAAKADLQIELDRFDIEGLILKQRRFPFTLQYDHHLSVVSDFEVNIDYFGMPMTFGPTSFSLHEDQLKIMNEGLSIDDRFEAALDGLYDLTSGQGTFDLHGAALSYKEYGDLYRASDIIPFDLFTENGGLHMTSSALGLDVTTHQDGWSADLYELRSISRDSKSLQDEGVLNGRVSLKSEGVATPITFTGKIDYPHAIFIKDGLPRHEITFSGTYEKDVTDIDLLDSINVTIGKEIRIRSKGVGYDSDALADFIKRHDSESNTTDFPELSLIADDTMVYLSKRSIALADTITVDMDKQGLTASLIHDKGVAIFEYKDGRFFADGQNFGAQFMTALFPTSSYEDGSLLFNVHGTLDEAEGLVHIDHAILKEYQTLNNVLAFINTVPSLVTFSLPNYSTKGIEITEAYAKFTYKDDKTYFDTLDFDSPEMKIVGNGITDYPNNRIDMNMTFKTDLGTTLSQVPVVGYLLLGKDGSISTSFKITGKIDDPQVETQTVQDIVVAPFNIIKRAVTLPFWLFDSDR